MQRKRARMLCYVNILKTLDACRGHLEKINKSSQHMTSWTKQDILCTKKKKKKKREKETRKHACAHVKSGHSSSNTDLYETKAQNTQMQSQVMQAHEVNVDQDMYLSSVTKENNRLDNFACNTKIKKTMKELK